ncbi:MAG TPA: formimidoylglutamate deiminase [Beijerinckiaceae bacterium]|jgi:formimidoylglutamate deiminase
MSSSLRVTTLDPAGQARERVLAIRDGWLTEEDGSVVETVSGLTLPGVPNLHSHAFQRAMAGLAERAGPVGDSFWTWREVMYRFLARLEPDDVEAIAAQLYVELLKSGVTSVGEFHYLHTAPDGHPYGDVAEMADRIVAAAETSGIRLTLLPVLYQTSQFGGAPPTEGQRRFVLPTDVFARLVQDLVRRHGGKPLVRLGIAPHSLRAVTPDALDAAVALAREIGPEAPIHIHAAEQVKEVEDCLAWSGSRPVAWLLDHQPVDQRWCLIHCTHLDADERGRLARSGAVVGLCPSTEANLGDGVFPFPDFLAEGGRFGVGSDSNVCVSPAEELRLVETVQRLNLRARNVGERQPGHSVGTALLARATAGGAQALALAGGALAPGQSADLVVLDTDHPSLVGRSGATAIDSWIFGSHGTSPVRDVMVGGAWVVRDGHHAREDEILDRFRRTMRRLAS